MFLAILIKYAYEDKITPVFPKDYTEHIKRYVFDSMPLLKILL